MRVYVNREKEEIVQGLDYSRTITTLRFKRRNRGNLEVVFTDGSSAVELPASAVGKVALKLKDNFTADPLAMAASWTKTGTGADTFYAFDLNLNTDEIDAAFAGDNENLPKIDVMFEIEWRESETRIASTATIYADLYNDVIRGDESLPSPGSPTYLTAEEAYALFLQRSELDLLDEVFDGGYEP